MAKKNKVKEKENKKPRIRLTLEEYQKAISRAGEPDVIQRLGNIYQSSEESRQSQKASNLAKQSSKGFVGYGLSKSKKTTGEKEFSTKARKLINLIAPKGSLVKAYTYGGGVSRGRGRPRKTYKARFVPGVGYVRVPTAVYNKMISEYKTRQRLLQAQRMAVAEQEAMQTDGRYQPDISDEQFLTEPEIQGEMAVQPPQQVQYPQNIPQQPQQNFLQRLTQGISNLGNRQPQYGRPPMRNPFYSPPQQPLYGGSPQPPQYNPQMQPLKREPKITVISEPANLLRVPSNFDRPENAQILFKGQRRFI